MFVATGDYVAQETFAALQILREVMPELHTKCVYVSEISCFCFGAEHGHCLTLDTFEKTFGKGDVPIIFSYHGYVQDLQQLLFGHPHSRRFEFHGYSEHGSTTTPFDMLVRNGCSRYDLVLSALEKIEHRKPKLAHLCDTLIEKFRKKLQEHREYIEQNGDDMPEIKEFKFIPFH